MVAGGSQDTAMPVACNSSGFYKRVVRAPARAVEHGMKIDTRRLGSPRTGQGEREFAAFYSKHQSQFWWYGMVNPWGELRDITYETHNGCSRSRRLQNTFSQSCAGCHRHLMCRARADSLTGANRENPRPGIWPFCSSAAQRLRSMPSIKLRDR